MSHVRYVINWVIRGHYRFFIRSLKPLKHSSLRGMSWHTFGMVCEWRSPECPSTLRPWDCPRSVGNNMQLKHLWNTFLKHLWKMEPLTHMCSFTKYPFAKERTYFCVPWCSMEKHVPCFSIEQTMLFHWKQCFSIGKSCRCRCCCCCKDRRRRNSRTSSSGESESAVSEDGVFAAKGREMNGTK